MEASVQHALALPGVRRRPVRQSGAKAVAAELPVASVLLDVALPHLDRDFDYLVPAELSALVQPGCRVEVRFAGRKQVGLVLRRSAQSSSTNALHPISRVISPEPVLTPEIGELLAELASRYAGTRADLARLAIPPRHARAEAKPAVEVAYLPEPCVSQAAEAWSAVQYGPAYWQRLREGLAPRGAWAVSPGQTWAHLFAQTALALAAAGRGSVLVVPDNRELDRLMVAFADYPDSYAMLTAKQSTEARYREFLRISRGQCLIAIGTRSAAFAPVANLSWLAQWDDGDDSYAEPRAPYPNTREVLSTRAHSQRVGLLLAAAARSVETQALVEAGWVRDLGANRQARPVIRVSGDSEYELRRDPHARHSRLPQSTHRAITGALAHGPVLVVTPRTGYQRSLACASCWGAVRCPQCAGPLLRESQAAELTCGWCGEHALDWACPDCGGQHVRAAVIGERRTAEELGKAFAPTRIRMATAQKPLASVDATAQIVVATPGAEPVAEGGYAAVVLLDAWLWRGGSEFRQEEEAARRAFNALNLLRADGAGFLVGDPGQGWVQALVRGDPVGLASRLLAERTAAGLPPMRRFCAITGTPGAVDDARSLLRVPRETQTMGPLPVGDQERLVLAVPLARTRELTAALREMSGLLAARKLGSVKVQVDPVDL